MGQIKNIKLHIVTDIKKSSLSLYPTTTRVKMPGLPDAEGLKDFKIPKKKKAKVEVKEEPNNSDDDFQGVTNGNQKIKTEEDIKEEDIEVKNEIKEEEADVKDEEMEEGSDDESLLMKSRNKKRKAEDDGEDDDEDEDFEVKKEEDSDYEDQKQKKKKKKE